MKRNLKGTNQDWSERRWPVKPVPGADEPKPVPDTIPAKYSEEELFERDLEDKLDTIFGK